MSDSYNRQGRSGNLPFSRNWGQADDEETRLLYRQLDDMYYDIANAINALIKKQILDASDPPASDLSNKFYSIGDITIRTDNNKAWIMTSRTTDIDVTWTLIT